MAIALRAVGTRLKVDLSAGGAATQSVGLPAGHVSGDLILLWVLTDDNTNTTGDPVGWSRLFYITNGSSVATPYTPRPRLKLYWRLDDGSLGTSVLVTFNNTSAWPAGKPSVLAYTVAYSGVDSSAPIGEWGWRTDLATTAAQAHPTITTSRANDWLLTYRAVSSDSPGATFTDSVGTDVERQDDIDVINELACALYDSNTALSGGVQTVRTTTASRAATYGSLMVSLAIQAPGGAAAATANAQTAEATGTAYDASVTSADGPWAFCTPNGLPVYTFAIDWAGDGSFADPGDDVTLKITSDVAIAYGRDQDRQLNPAAVGSASFTVINADRTFSPDFASSVLFGDLEPARQLKGSVLFGGNTYPLLRSKIDDYNIRADLSDRTVDFTFLDGLADLQNVKLSTGVYTSMRTGDLIDTILDLVGWTGGRDIGLGATVVPYWWAEGTDALTAITDLVKSEGPPSVAYQAPDGTFVFRDRHHRLQRSQSIGVQASFAQPTLMDCTAAPLAGLDFTAPFVYAHGWRDIINSVTFEVAERSVESTLSAVWTSDDSNITLATGESEVIDFSTTDPFVNAVTPISGTDFTLTGAGTLNVVLSRNSGQSATLSLLAVGGSVTISGLQVRAQLVSVRRNVKVNRVDTGSISLHGEKTYPETAPWANANDADAIAGMILLHYATRRPTIQLRVTSQDPAHYVQALTRTVSDRIHVQYDEMGINDDFFIERVAHTIQRMNAPGRPPVHAVVFGCERNLVSVANPFTFDKRGAGFDQGVFDPIQADDASTVFIFDHPTQGQFDVGQLGT